MTTLREAAQQALEALHAVLKDDYRLPYEKIVAATDALNVALAEPVQYTGVKLKPVFYAPRRLDDEEVAAIIAAPPK